MKLHRTNGPRPSAAQRHAHLAAICFAGPIIDALGVERRELYEDEAEWQLVAETLMLTIGEPPRSILTVVGSDPPAPPQVVPVPVPMYRIVHRPPGAGGRVAVLMIPVSQVRCVRRPARIVEQRDASGEVVSRDLMTPAQAAEQAAADIARGGAAEH